METVTDLGGSVTVVKPGRVSGVSMWNSSERPHSAGQYVLVVVPTAHVIHRNIVL
jgi:hypothetical protein